MDWILTSEAALATQLRPGRSELGLTLPYMTMVVREGVEPSQPEAAVLQTAGLTNAQPHHAAIVDYCIHPQVSTESRLLSQISHTGVYQLCDTAGQP